jgi:hypothetical protein
MQWMTLVPSWLIQDAVVLILGALTVGFIVKHEKNPLPILLEFLCFMLLYAGIYENLASVMGWYKFGRSWVMVFNVPITVPMIEYLFVYCCLRFCQKAKFPTWTVPLFAGAMGVVADLPLDPLAMVQRAITQEVPEGIGRWTWYISPTDAQVLEVPIYNFSGWMLLCGYAAVWLLVGRHWYQKSGEKPSVGMLYPPIFMLIGLLTMCSPLSSFLLWLGPIFNRGDSIEYVMLGLCFVALAVSLILWRGKMRQRLAWKEDWIIPVVFGVFHFSILLFGLIGQHWKVVAFGLPFMFLQMGIIAFGFTRKLPSEQEV